MFNLFSSQKDNVWGMNIFENPPAYALCVFVHLSILCKVLFHLGETATLVFS